MTEMNNGYKLEDDEKITPIIVYTAGGVTRGDAISKKPIRVNTWLRTPSAPDYFHLLNARMMLVVGGSPNSGLAFKEYYLPTCDILAYHLVPPATEPLDYDESELNRKMEPVTIMVSTFRINGQLRISGQTTLGKHIEINHESFSSIYNVEITNPILPTLPPIRAPLLLLRPGKVSFALKGQ